LVTGNQTRRSDMVRRVTFASVEGYAPPKKISGPLPPEMASMVHFCTTLALCGGAKH